MADGEIGVAGGPVVPGEKRSCVRTASDDMGCCPTLPCPAAQRIEPGYASQITLATCRASTHKSKAAGGTDKVHEKDHTTQKPRIKIRQCGCAKRFFGSGSWFVTCYCHGRVGRRIGRVVRYSRRPAG